MGYSPYFLLYGRDPLFPSRIQHLEDKSIDPNDKTALGLHLAERGAIFREVMPLAMRNLAIAQQRDQERFRHVRGGSYDRPKATFKAGDLC